MRNRLLLTTPFSFHLKQLTVYLAARATNLITICCPCSNEIYYRLKPKGTVFHRHILQCCPHCVQAHKATYTKRGGEHNRHALPKGWNIALWP